MLLLFAGRGGGKMGFYQMFKILGMEKKLLSMKKWLLIKGLIRYVTDPV